MRVWGSKVFGKEANPEFHSDWCHLNPEYKLKNNKDNFEESRD
jgi:hypothetical protein